MPDSPASLSPGFILRVPVAKWERFLLLNNNNTSILFLMMLT